MVPEEWTISEAWIKDEFGNKIVDFAVNNLHVVGYSIPVNLTLTLEDLQCYLYSREDLPNAIPYVTKYYQRGWGFCIEHEKRLKLKSGKYQVFIDSSHFNGELNFGELILKGDSNEEIFLSTYICHPSMANNELSGPALTIEMVRWLKTLSRRKYSYRVIFIPETIGSIVYLSKNISLMRENIKAGFNITCVGDDRAYSFLPSRLGNTLPDRVSNHVLGHIAPDYIKYSYLDRGSDERQYCAPGIDLPVVSVMRSKYAEYPEYHTSLDDLSLVTPSGLEGASNAMKKIIEALERNCEPKLTTLGEPQLGRRGLYPGVSDSNTSRLTSVMMNFLAYADGINDLIQIAELIHVPVWDLYDILENLCYFGIVEKVDPTRKVSSQTGI